MTSTPQAPDGAARVVVPELAGAGAVLDMAAAKIAVAILQGDPWVERITRADVEAVVEASVSLEAALIRILAGESLDLAARVEYLGDLARRTADSEMRACDAGDAPTSSEHSRVVELAAARRAKRAVSKRVSGSHL